MGLKYKYVAKNQNPNGITPTDIKRVLFVYDGETHQSTYLNSISISSPYTGSLEWHKEFTANVTYKGAVSVGNQVKLRLYRGGILQETTTGKQLTVRNGDTIRPSSVSGYKVYPSMINVNLGCNLNQKQYYFEINGIGIIKDSTDIHVTARYSPNNWNNSASLIEIKCWNDSDSDIMLFVKASDNLRHYYRGLQYTELGRTSMGSQNGYAILTSVGSDDGYAVVKVPAHNDASGSYNRVDDPLIRLKPTDTFGEAAANGLDFGSIYIYAIATDQTALNDLGEHNRIIFEFSKADDADGVTNDGSGWNDATLMPFRQKRSLYKTAQYVDGNGDLL